MSRPLTNRFGVAVCAYQPAAFLTPLPCLLSIRLFVPRASRDSRTGIGFRSNTHHERPSRNNSTGRRCLSTLSTAAEPGNTSSLDAIDTFGNSVEEIVPGSSRATHLNPDPSSYSMMPFVDRCSVTIQAGNGGHGCVSFLREKFIAEGPPNGGNGGHGGSVYIQAVRGETSLHKIARKGMVRAGRGRNGQGSGQGGQSGEDILLTVPVGTVVKEAGREIERGKMGSNGNKADGSYRETEDDLFLTRDKWIVYPGHMKPSDWTATKAATGLKERQSRLAALEPPAPIRLDLDTPMDRPMLLAAGAVGGLGNPHFATQSQPRPKYATKGETCQRIRLDLELKMLADVGLVGLPNAGKSTLLRALSNSRTRIGNWPFTTLQPSIGTIVLDNHRGRPTLQAFEKDGRPRTSFNIADIPGLIKDAHLDKGLGLGFLRHIERANVLAFVVDLSAGDAVEALKALWREVAEYETLSNRQLNADTENHVASHSQLEPGRHSWPRAKRPEDVTLAPVTSKPWFVVATKADLPDTQLNYAALHEYVGMLMQGVQDHPSGRKNAWTKAVRAVPVSAINAEGVSRIPKIVVELL